MQEKIKEMFKTFLKRTLEKQKTREMFEKIGEISE